MKYILSLSFGKDSMALLLEVLKRKMPLDYVIFSEIKFDTTISGEHPLMAEWIPKAENILKDNYGVDVVHLSSSTTFCDIFYKKKIRGKHIGQNYGFPYLNTPWCNGELKMKPIKKFINDILKFEPVIEYIGIAKDELKRLERYKSLETKNHKYITLADFDIDELQAMNICKDNNLLSPKYTKSFRGGCWFCNRQSLYDLWCLWFNYPDYFDRLIYLETGNYNNFRFQDKSLSEIKNMFEQGFIPKKRVRFIQYSMFGD